MSKLIQVMICLLIPFMVENILWINFEFPLNAKTWKRSSNTQFQMLRVRNTSRLPKARNSTTQTQSTEQQTGDDLKSMLGRLPDPVFVTYGNQGYSSLLKNFVCNMALFPPMHRHMLIIVSENRTAEMIKSYSNEVSVWILPSPLNDSYDFETLDYIRLMMHRGKMLVNLLELAQTQAKTIVWIEPDFHYTQNLLNRPEITQQVSDLVLFWDFNNFCGCFIRFAPVPGSLFFYKEIMQRMEQNQLEGGNTNDQMILNSVVAEHLPNYTLFDPCLYRSGLSTKAKLVQRNASECLGKYPVAQHHNWIIGLQNKVKMAKEERGWFLRDDDMACSTRDIRLVVMTMNRAWSLDRLLKSLDHAKYPPGASVDLQVTIDRDFSENVDQPTMKILESLDWRHGIYEVKVWPHKVGLYGQWVESWPAELYPNDLYKAVILLEDDLEVSPYYFTWFTEAHKYYGGKEKVAAITGQRPNLVAAINGPASVESVVPEGTKAFGYMLMATWSLSPIPQVWCEFRQWVKDKRTNYPDFVPTVPGIVPDQWYSHFRSRGEEENMWEMWFIRFVDERGLHTIYPWVSNGREAMVSNWKEVGLHFSGIPTLDFPVCQTWDDLLLEQSPLPLVGYDLKFPPKNKQHVEAQNQSRIPVHFVWVQPFLQPTDTEAKNPKLLKSQIQAKSVSQDWGNKLTKDKFEIILWTDREICNEFPSLVPILSRISVPAWISDVLRYHIIYRFGGVYLDTDVLAVHDFSPLLENFNSSFSVCQTPWQPIGQAAQTTPVQSCESVINAIIAAPINHPAVKCAAEKSLDYTASVVADGIGQSYSVEATGPALWTSCTREYNGINILPSWTFLACSFFSRDSCNRVDYAENLSVYGMHEWKWSWG